MKVQDSIFYETGIKLIFTDFNNLRLAYLKALKGKRFSSSAIVFGANADINLFQIKKFGVTELQAWKIQSI